MADQPSREEQIASAVLQFATRVERTAYLKGACAGDAALLQRVEALLLQHEQAGDSPDPDVTVKSALSPNPPVVEPLTEKPGDRIGRYKLLQEIGEGGMGSVWMAEQEVPVRRRVALKVVKLGMDTKQVIARFEAERQALALMDHPNIARVLDAGATDTGRPFFVMELVRGVPITEYCDQNNLSPQQRLELFIPVCKAIQHAHQKGIIHRDIKPSNILVTLHDGVPVPKVIDFGIAKAVDQPLTEKTLFTRFEQFMGTPAYMSPEQAEMSGLDIDTRSDIYALGVLLYELLTGKPPFDPDALVKSGVDAMRKTIREVEPPRPSTRLSTLAAADLTAIARKRGTEPARLSALVRGDLDWIVMKCLEKDRTRRYETANGLAMDVARYLDNEPVAARPPSTAYRFQKAFRRHKLAFAAGGAVIAALILGVIGTTVGFVRAERQRRVAEAAQHLAQENFDQARAAVGDLLAVSDEDLYDLPGMQPLRVKLMRAAIDRYTPFLDRPSADPAPRAELARLYAKYAFTAEGNGADRKTVAVPAYESALAIQQQLVHEHPESRSLRSDLGWTYIFYAWNGDFRAAKTQQICAQAVTVFEALVREGPDDPLARADLAWALWETTWGPPDPRWLTLSERALAIREQLVKEFPHSAEFRRDLANSLHIHALHVQDPGAALAVLSRVISLREALVADMEQKLPSIWQPLRPRGSEALLVRPSLLWTKRDVAWGCADAARDHAELKQWPEAIALSDRAVGIYRQLVEENPSVRQFISELVEASIYNATAEEAAGNADAAQARLRDAMNLLRARLPVDDPLRLKTQYDIGDAYRTTGRSVDAIPLLEETLRVCKAKLAPDDVITLDTMNNLALAYRDFGRSAEAVSLLEETLKLMKAKLGPDDRDTLNTANNLASAYRAGGRLAEAAPMLEETLRVCRAKLGLDDPWTLTAAYNLVDAYWAAGRLTDAETMEKEVLVDLRARLAADDPELAGWLAQLTRTLLRNRKFSEAEPPARECLAIREKKLPNDFRAFNAKSLLGGSLLGQKKYAEAEPLLVSGYEGLKQREDTIPTEGRYCLKEALQRLVQLYEVTGRPDQAVEWKRKLEKTSAP
jgi:tetratricopeptide (TPR) repeat protein/tRNA A-37 threonylcarbamoyl transferase component Bud32